MDKYTFHTLGCKLNYSESNQIAESFEDIGLQKANFGESSDVFVLNTCSVTENADKKCRKLIRDFKRKNPEGKIAVIGCYAQLKAKEISEIEGVNLVLGASDKFQLAEHLKNIDGSTSTAIHQSELQKVTSFNHSSSTSGRTRSFLKVQDGCNYSCTFCTIPLARGASRSPSVSSIVKRAEKLAENDFKEIVLTGVNIGDFGFDPSNNGKQRVNGNFLALIKALDEVEGIERFRISSIEPNLLTNEIINFVASSKKFVPHFHIPLQSGSAEILKSMRRRYNKELYQDRVSQIKKVMPLCCIGADVIIGYPGEAEEHFQETFNFLQDLGVSYLHVFTYSERDNTPAKEMSGVVVPEQRAKRSSRLHQLSDKLRLNFYNKNLDHQSEVLWEKENREGLMYGFSSNYIRVKRKFDESWANKLALVTIKEIDKDGVCLILD